MPLNYDLKKVEMANANQINIIYGTDKTLYKGKLILYMYIINVKLMNEQRKAAFLEFHF